jgi:hypothetical protein
MLGGISWESFPGKVKGIIYGRSIYFGDQGNNGRQFKIAELSFVRRRVYRYVDALSTHHYLMASLPIAPILFASVSTVSLGHFEKSIA